jgi:hypothetical protein
MYFLPKAIAAATAVLMFACSRPSANLVADSDMRDIDQFWTMQGRVQFRPGLGPDGHAMMFVPGGGGPTGYRSDASFLALVEPGQTFTFSAYIDATGHQGTPPFVVLDAVNGTWTGVSVYQLGKGVVSKTFFVPAYSGTTLVRGTFNTENGTYPIGRGAALSEPQIEPGDFAHDYAGGGGGELTQQPAGGNLVIDSGLRDAHRTWELIGAMRLDRNAAGGNGAIVYDGDGHPSGFANRASFFARVVPGRIYTFSALVDGSSSVGTPAYVFLRAMDGTWEGTQVSQPGKGRVFQTFTIPAKSRTTCINGWISPQNGEYARGTHMTFSQPQIAEGPLPLRYVEGPPPPASSQAQGGCR